MKAIEIRSTTETLSATLFEGDQKNIVLITASATGVKQTYYQKFAQFIADHGITVLTFDYTGIGRSLKKPIKKLQNNAADWGRNDLESVIQHVVTTYPHAKKVVLGHSIGGQLIGLAASAKQLDKIILVAAQSGYWKLWKGFGKLKMWIYWYLLFPLVIQLFGYLRSKELGGMENLPKNMANQWRNWGKHPNYIFSDSSIHPIYYDQINAYLTAFSIDDDALAPLDAVAWITSQYKNAIKKSIHLEPAHFNSKNIGHFGVFKEKFSKTIWPMLLEELTNFPTDT